MKLVDTYLGLASLLNLVTLLNSYPWNAEEYTTASNRGQDDARSRWAERQQILQIIMPTESSKNDRILAWTKRATTVSQPPYYTTERQYNEPYSSQEKAVQPRRQQGAGHGHVMARPKPRPNVAPEKLHLRLGTADDPSVLCEEVQSRTSTSQTYRRSPRPSQDASSKSQQVVRSGTFPKDIRCGNTNDSSSPTTMEPLYSATNRSLSSVSYKPPSTIPRPPTTNRPLLTTSRSSAGTTKALGDIVFPDRNHFPSFVPRTKCKGSTFCEDVGDDYPAEHIKRLLKTESVEFRAYFGQDEINEVNITHRIDVSDESPLCPSVQHIVYPKSAQNKDDNWMFIVNIEDKSQGFRIETCVHDGDCALREELPWGYTFSCKQKYISRKMLALDDKGEAVTDHFKLPSCCSCFFKTSLKVSRMGVGEKMSPAITPRQNTKNKN